MTLGLPDGMILELEGRSVTLRATRGWSLDIVEEDGRPVLAQIPGTDRFTVPDVDWLIAMAKVGDLVDPNDPRGRVAGRRGEFLTLDRSACVARDPKSACKHDWAVAALKAGIKRSKPAAEAFIKSEPPPAPGPKPKWRSLLRWMATLEIDPHLRIGNLVSTAGREVGQSQLPEIVDLLVQEEVATFWTPTGDPWKLDPAGRIAVSWHELKDAGVQDIGDEAPSAECVRQRINSLQNRATYAARHGQHAADRFYGAKGEPVEVAHVFERVTVDGVVFSHACVFSDDWSIPAAKMKGVFCMDQYSEYVFPGSVFSGPFRAETSTLAIMNVMTPPEVDPDDPEVDEFVRECFGIPSNLHPDNDRTLMPPGTIPGLVNVVSWAELPKIYHSNSKAKHERFHRFLKGVLKRLPGRILGPRTSRDPRYDPLASAEVTRAQYVKLADTARHWWNTRPKKSLGGRSPFQVLKEGILARGARDIPAGMINREMSRTVPNLILTTNGVEYDGVRYRFNEKGVESTLDANANRTPFADQLEDTGKCVVTGRVWDGDVDQIEICDERTREYHRLWSTDPDYTSGLTRWEHHEYKKMLAAGRGGGTRKQDRLVQRGRQLREFDSQMPKLRFRARETAVALLEGEETRRASGRLGRTAAYDRLLAIAIPTDVGGAEREDVPSPPPQPAGKANGVPLGHRAPERDPEHGFSTGPRGRNADATDASASASPADGDGSDGDTVRRSRWAVDRDDDEDDFETDEED